MTPPPRPPALAVVAEDDTFADYFAQLAERLDLALETMGLAEARPRAGVVAHLLVCAGREDHAVEMLHEVQRAGLEAPLVVGAAAEHRLAVALMRRGAAAYFALPTDDEALEEAVRQRAEARREADGAAPGGGASGDHDFEAIIGRDPGLRAALERASRVIPSGRATVLITGETGTGKELLAEAVHRNGPRAGQPFVPVNCSAIPENLLESELFGHEKGAFTGATAAKPGLFEVADGGTLFLDEVATLPAELQAKLLRVLESGEVRRVGGVRTERVDVRIVAAANVDLRERVEEGRFRDDLYYRLAVIPLHLPPLRERGEDVRLLAHHFLAALAEEYGMETPEVEPEALRHIDRHPWPGNVRELRNSMERALLLSGGEPITPGHLALEETSPGHGQRDAGAGSEAGLPFPATLEELEVAAVKRMIELCDGNKSEAARRLGIARSRLYRLLELGAETEPDDDGGDA